MFTTPITRREMLALTGSIGLAAWASAKSMPVYHGPVLSQSIYDAHVLSLKPAGYWRLSETKGLTVPDLSGHKRDGVYHHQALSRGVPVKNKSEPIVFDGRSYVEIPSHKAFSVSSAGLTVEAWLDVGELDFPGQTGVGDEPYVHWLGKGDKGQFEWGFRFYCKHKKNGQVAKRANRISAYIWNPISAVEGTVNEGAGAYFQDELTPRQRLHVVAVYDPPGPEAGVRIYCDGTFRKGPPDRGTLYSSYDVSPVAGAAPLRLGTRDLASFLTGGLETVAIYPRMLSAAEIKENYHLGARRHHEMPRHGLLAEALHRMGR